jgi:hypothetical protein
MPSPDQLATKYAKVPRGESVADAALRAASYAGAMIDAGHGELLTERLAEPKLDRGHALPDLSKALAALARAGQPVATKAALDTIARAEQRLGATLPATVTELWHVLGAPAYGKWLRGFCSRLLLDPAQLVSPPKWAAEAKLACVSRRNSFSDTRERFDDEYAEWFDEAEATVKVTSAKQLAKHTPKLGKTCGLMLAPELRESIISIAIWHSEAWFVVTDLASATAPAPMFANHDDGEGYSDYLAKDVRAWLSAEVSDAMRAVANADD